MGGDEAVALLLDLANVKEADYLKAHPQSPWPPQAAHDIAAECGMLPITLTIAAQAVRYRPRCAFRLCADDCVWILFVTGRGAAGGVSDLDLPSMIA